MQYGPRGSIIDTARPFRVHAHFEARVHTHTCMHRHMQGRASVCRHGHGHTHMPTRTSLDVRYCTQAAGGVLRGLDMTLAQAGRTLRFSPVPSHCLARHRCLAHAMRMPSTCLAHACRGSVPPRFIVLAWHSPYAWGRVTYFLTLYRLTDLPTYPLTYLPTYPLTYC